MANNSTLLVALTVALVLLLEQQGGGVLGQPPTSSMPCPAKSELFLVDKINTKKVKTK
jgi:hypothetical protein